MEDEYFHGFAVYECTSLITGMSKFGIRFYSAGDEPSFAADRLLGTVHPDNKIKHARWFDFPLGSDSLEDFADEVIDAIMGD